METCGQWSLCLLQVLDQTALNIQVGTLIKWLLQQVFISSNDKSRNSRQMVSPLKKFITAGQSFPATKAIISRMAAILAAKIQGTRYERLQRTAPCKSKMQHARYTVVNIVLPYKNIAVARKETTKSCEYLPIEITNSYQVGTYVIQSSIGTYLFEKGWCQYRISKISAIALLITYGRYQYSSKSKLGPNLKVPKLPTALPFSNKSSSRPIRKLWIGTQVLVLFRTRS